MDRWIDECQKQIFFATSFTWYTVVLKEPEQFLVQKITLSMIHLSKTCKKFDFTYRFIFFRESGAELF